MLQATIELPNSRIRELDNYMDNFSSGNWTIIEFPEENASYMKGYFQSKSEVDENYQKLKNYLTWLPEQPKIKKLKSADWQNEYKKHFKPWCINNMHWVPKWRKNDYFVPKNDKVIYLDPGMAFGMMDHPSTRLCVQILMDFYTLNRKNISEKTMIDVGCGSGILSLSATLLGFKKAYAFENDPIAVNICRKNRLINDIRGNLIIKSKELKNAISGEKADLILANVLSKIQINHAELLINAIKPQGILGLSGILKSELQEVKDTFSNIIRKNRLQLKLQVDEIGKWTSITIHNNYPNVDKPQPNRNDLTLKQRDASHQASESS